MGRILRQFLRTVVDRTGIGLLPVRVRGGMAAGARWTLFPWSSYWRGTHEPELQSAIARLGGGDIRGWSCWDLGAHYGIYSVGLARRVGPNGQVAAFEPNPASFRRLQRHRDMNGLGWLKIYQAAVSDQDGGAELFTYGTLDSTTTHLPYENETRTGAVGAIAIATVRLDDLVASGELRAPHFVKVDVEGHAQHAFAGMTVTVRRSRPIFVVAFHSQSEIDGVLATLTPLGYTWRAISGGAECPPPSVGDYLFTPTGIDCGGNQALSASRSARSTRFS